MKIYYGRHRLCRMAPEPGDRTRRGFGELEQQVLAVLWAAREPLVPREVRERMHDAPAYTTVMTILVRLHHKGLAARERRRNAYAYSAVESEASATAERIRGILDGGGDRTAVLQGLVSALNADDAAELRRLLRRARPSTSESDHA
jgi:predicted transcriptional regulator